jgi:hypothetical protein
MKLSASKAKLLQIGSFSNVVAIARPTKRLCGQRIGAFAFGDVEPHEVADDLGDEILYPFP